MLRTCLVLIVLCAGCAPDVERFRDPVDAGLVDNPAPNTVPMPGNPDSSMVSADAGETPSSCIVLFQVSLPDVTPTDARIHIAGNFFDGDREWLPGDPTLALQRNSDGAGIELNLTNGQQVDYKYTLGNWEGVEVDADCNDIDDRIITIDCASAMPEQQDVVVAWKGVCP